MKELQKSNREPSRATDDMCMFIALNASAIELLPTSVLALRAAAGSADAYSVIWPTFASSVVGFVGRWFAVYGISQEEITQVSALFRLYA